jgi:heat-inducible transcriptional repressor
MELDARSTAILQQVVDGFIREAQPVGSGTIASRLSDVSPATVRAVMAELEAQGLLHQPHTSAGRIPTEKGMRAYVDSITKPRLRKADRSRLDAAAAGADLTDLPAALGQSLAGLSGQVAVVAVPRFLGSRFSEVGLVRLETRRFLAIFVSHGGVVQQKMVETDFDIDLAQLQLAQNFLNEHLKRQSVSELRDAIRQELDGQRSRYDSLRREALQIGIRTLMAQSDDLEIIVEGASHLVGQPEFTDFDRLRDLLRAIEERTALLELLEHVLDGFGVQVMLGSEHHVRVLSPEVACVGVPTVGPDGRSAALTLLGPARMDYTRLLPLVDYAAELFGRSWRVH